MTNHATTAPVIHQDISAELEALRAENARLKAAALVKASSRLAVKVKPLGQSDDNGEPMKGNVAVYGLGRFPVTLYPQQWLKLLAIADDIRAEIKTHKDVLSWKD